MAATKLFPGRAIRDAPRLLDTSEASETKRRGDVNTKPETSIGSGRLFFKKVLEYLASAVAAQPLQMLPVGEVSGQQAVLERDARVDKGRRPTVVVHEEGLKVSKMKTQPSAFGMFEIWNLGFWSVQEEGKGLLFPEGRSSAPSLEAAPAECLRTC